MGQTPSPLKEAIATGKAQLTAQGQAQLDKLTGSSAQSARLVNASGAMLDLASHGFNPDDKGDQQKLIAAIAGGTALIPVVGPVLAASVEGLYQVGSVIACPVVKFFHDIGIGGSDCDSPPCTTSGIWTP